jgi:hypothetical protein
VRRGTARAVARSAVTGGHPSTARIRDSFAGLARGLVALHAEGKIHRDLKPSNVLVDAHGKVTILDFGLVSNVATTEALEPNELLGTPSYMSPEQAALRPLTPASDWYSFGVMLHEALTGRLPARGQVMPSDAWPSGVPSDLSELCAELVRLDPSERPSGWRVLERLLGEPPALAVPTSRAVGESIFVGRDAELAALASAAARVAAGEPVTVLLEGESGVGKTALVREFLARLPKETVVLTARCYERESLPYKAVDGVVEELCKYLSALPAEEARVALAGQASTIARAFPAMERLRRSLEPEASEEAVFEPHAERLRVFAALRQLLSWLARERRVVIVIDDMQWSDVDSLALLASVMRSPAAPPLLLVAVQRFGSLLSATALPGIVLEQRLGPLSESESAVLVTRLCEAAAAAPKSDAERSRMSAEARGHPLFLHEIVRHATGASNGRQLSMRLDEALWHRVSELSTETRLLVELVSVAGRPMAQATLVSALSVASGTPTSLDGGPDGEGSLAGAATRLAELRQASLVRTSGPHPKDAVEPFHDRVREAVLAHLAPHESRVRHRCLAVAIELGGVADPEALSTHWYEAGDPVRAHAYAVAAADQAAATLAFDHAARLYRFALELETTDTARRWALHGKLGDALANAGRGAEAARAYTAAAREGAPEPQRFQRMAAEQLLQAGYIQEGLSQVSHVLREIGVGPPRHRAFALFSLITLRARIRACGFRTHKRTHRAPSAKDMARIDGTWTAAICLTMFDNVRSAELQCRNTLLALRCGTPLQVLRAHTAEAMFLGLGGQGNKRRIAQLLASAEAIADELGDRNARAWVALSRGATAFFLGSWSEGEAACCSAESVFKNRAGARFELGSARAFRVWSAMMCGRFREVLELVPKYVDEAEERGDLYSATYQMTGFSNVAWLSRDDVAEARRRLALVEERWPPAEFDVPRYMNLMAAAHIELYDGTGATAYRRVLRDWRSLRWGVAFRAQITRFGMRFARGLSALAAFDTGAGVGLLHDAAGCAAAIARERVAWSTCFAEILRFGVALRRGRPARAVEHLERAERLAETTEMHLHQAVVRHRRGELVGGDEGRKLVRFARAYMDEQRIVNPQRMLDMLSPRVSPS